MHSFPANPDRSILTNLPQRGVPVATVGINNSTNAALLAIRMLGSHYPEYQEKLARHQATMKEEVEVKAETLEDIGYQAYLEKQGKR